MPDPSDRSFNLTGEPIVRLEQQIAASKSDRDLENIVYEEMTGRKQEETCATTNLYYICLLLLKIVLQHAASSRGSLNSIDKAKAGSWRRVRSRLDGLASFGFDKIQHVIDMF